MLFDEAIEFQNLLKALKRCTVNTMWKESTARYWHNRLKNTYILRKELLDGTYRISQYLWFVITEPKEREIFASHIKDRQLQHALIDYIVYPAVTKSFIPGNCACQKGKGTKYCIDLLLKELRMYTRTHGYEGYVWQFDIKHFFPSTDHNVACECVSQYVDEKTAKHCSDVIRSFAEVEFAKILIRHGMNRKSAHRAGHKIAHHLIYGDDWQRAIKGLSPEQVDAITDRIRKGEYKGVGLGSQVTQTTQLTLLNGLDHYVTEVLKPDVYVRYMDDGLMVHESKEYLRYCEVKIAEYLQTIKLYLNNKTQLFPLKQGFIFLHWRIFATITGKVVVHKHRVKINRERRRLRKQRKLLDAGKITMEDIAISFQSWQAHILQQGCYKQVIQMRRFYWILFERSAPQWKSKLKRLMKQGRKTTFISCVDRSWETCINGMLPQ